MTSDALSMVFIILGITAFAIGLASLISPLAFLGIRTRRAGLMVMALGVTISMLAGAAAYLAKCC